MTSIRWERSDVSTRIFRSGWWLILVGLVIGGILGAADYLANGSPSRALIDVAIVVGYTAALAVFRARSETAGVLAGDPVDERWQLINMRAMATAGQIAGFVSLTGFILAEATGHDWSGFAIVAGAVGIAYIGGVIWYRSRL
jgi:uncharacterized membrane protein